MIMADPRGNVPALLHRPLVHFVPRAGEVIHCRIRQLRLGRVDYLSFYHGKEANEDKLITKALRLQA